MSAFVALSMSLSASAATITKSHFEGGKNLSQGNKHGSGGTLSELVMDKNFHLFLRMVRETQAAVVSGVNSETASSELMRSALAKQEFALILGDFALNFMAEVESLIEAREKWLEENKNSPDDGKTAG